MASCRISLFVVVMLLTGCDEIAGTSGAGSLFSAKGNAAGVAVQSSSSSAPAVTTTSNTTASGSITTSSTDDASASSSETAAASTASTSSAQSDTAFTTATLASTSKSCKKYYTGAVRGLSCLHCMHPLAKRQSDMIASLLTASCLKNVAINYLIDGTFRYNASVVTGHAAKLKANGRNVYMHFYFTNGASQRQWETTPISSIGTQIPPTDFRTLIQTDDSLRAEFRGVVRRFVPTLRTLRKNGINVSVSPMLQDNLDQESLVAMNKLMQLEIPPTIGVKFVRNPCPECHSGNDTNIPSGMAGELHHFPEANSLRGGIVSNDGIYYLSKSHYTRIKASVPAGKFTTLGSMISMLQRAKANRNVFILWSGPRQGITVDQQAFGGNLAPDDRRYLSPSRNEQTWILKFLRYGL